MMMYLIITRPFKSKYGNIIHIYNELIVIVPFVFVIIWNLYEFSNTTISIFEWILVALILISLIAVCLISFPGILKEFYAMFRKLFDRKTNEEKDTLGNGKRIKELLKNKNKSMYLQKHDPISGSPLDIKKNIVNDAKTVHNLSYDG